MAGAVERDRATFLYDDCCPLCRTYTATFTALGWADRAPFSGIDDQVLGALDFDRARHHIPLVDKHTRQTQYGLDGILGVVRDHAPLLGAIGSQRHMRWVLDHVYLFITYNRRHIISSPPPATGIDCAPDYEPAQIKNYLRFCAMVTGRAGRAAPIAVAATALAATALVLDRDQGWNIKPLEAAGHAATVTMAGAGAGAIAKTLTGGTAVASLAVAAIAGRKLYLRRWMRTPR